MMAGQVSGAAIGGMIVTTLICLGIPAAALIYGVVKKKGTFISVLIGAGTFIVFALVLENMLHLLMQTVFKEQLTENLWLYALYGGLAAAIFEETGRFLSMKFLMKKSLTKGNAFMYGIGHGGVEAIIVTGTTCISNIVFSVMINAGQLEKLISGLEGTLKEQAMTQISALWTTPAHLFYLAGVERIGAFILQLCFSYIVYRAIKDRKASLFFLAMAIHFIVDAGTVVLSKTCSVYLTEAVLAIFAAALAIIVFRNYKAEKE